MNLIADFTTSNMLKKTIIQASIGFLLLGLVTSQVDLPQIQSFIRSQGFEDRLGGGSVDSTRASLDSSSSDSVSDSQILSIQESKWDLPPKGAIDTSRAAIQEANIGNISAGYGSSGKNVGFVKASGTRFTLGGKPYFCAGTNAYYMSRTDFLSAEEMIYQMMKHSEYQGNVLRVFFAYDFSPSGTQPELGVFNEDALRRIDLVMAAAANFGIRIIAVLGNYWPFVGGMQAYVNEWGKKVGRGSGQPLELFYTEPEIRGYYKKWLDTIITRTNTVTGLAYKDDPTIFAWELANEPHTSNQYEKNLGIQPGTILCAWVKEMSSYIKSLDSNHMITTGEEGYRSDGSCDKHCWLNNGYKGADFACNVCNTDISFATVHTYPDSWDMPDYEWLGDNYIQDRANVAASCNKPFILEEYGMGSSRNYLPSREPLLKYLQDEALDAGYSCVLVWAVAPYTNSNQPGDGQEGLLGSNDGQGYVFSYGGDGSTAVRDLYTTVANKNGFDPPLFTDPPQEEDEDEGSSEEGGSGGGNGPVSPPPPSSPSSSRLEGCEACTNIPPGGTLFILSGTTCSRLSSEGRCGDDDMQSSCDLSCGRCSCDGSGSGGSPTAPSPPPNDSPPPESIPSEESESFPTPPPPEESESSPPESSSPSSPSPPPPDDQQQQQPESGSSVGGCTGCTNLLPGSESIYSDELCEKISSTGDCYDDDMTGRCDLACGRCSCVDGGGGTDCEDVAPNSSGTCEQQARWGKCGADWMQGYCKSTCRRC